MLGLLASAAGLGYLIWGPIPAWRANLTAHGQHSSAYKTEQITRTTFRGVDAWQVVLREPYSGLRSTVWVDRRTGKILQIDSQAYPDTQ